MPCSFCKGRSHNSTECRHKREHIKRFQPRKSDTNFRKTYQPLVRGILKVQNETADRNSNSVQPINKTQVRRVIHESNCTEKSCSKISTKGEETKNTHSKINDTSDINNSRQPKTKTNNIITSTNSRTISYAGIQGPTTRNQTSTTNSKKLNCSCSRREEHDEMYKKLYEEKVKKMLRSGKSITHQNIKKN
jgi:hypothetical protein